PAKVAGVEPHLARDVRRGRRIRAIVVPVRQLVHQPHSSERERAVQMTLLQHADLSRVEAIEAAHLLDPRRINGRCRRRLLRRGLVDPPCPLSSRTHSPAPPWVIFDKVNQLVAVVKYHLKRSAAPPGSSDLAPLPSPEPEHDR